MKPREFWIAPHPEHTFEGSDDICVGDALKKHPHQGPPKWQASIIHVIEAAPVLAEIAQLKKENAQLKADLEAIDRANMGG